MIFKGWIFGVGDALKDVSGELFGDVEVSSKWSDVDYQRRCSDNPNKVAHYDYGGVLRIDGLAELKNECKSCREDLQKASDSVDVLEKFKVQVEEAEAVFRSVTPEDHEWVDYSGVGYKVLREGARNAAVASLHELLKQVCDDVQQMIEIRSIKFFYIKALGYLNNVTGVDYNGTWMAKGVCVL